MDLIVALGVLEHVENPLDMLKWAWRLLKSGGHFFLRVPNFANNPNDLFCADHLSKLTVPTLRALAASAGYEVLGVREAGVPVFVALQKSEKISEKPKAFAENEAIAGQNARIAGRSIPSHRGEKCEALPKFPRSGRNG